jgi:hypothetical protein
VSQLEKPFLVKKERERQKENMKLNLFGSGLSGLWSGKIFALKSHTPGVRIHR